MLRDLADHGLPLVQLKEQRRELIVAFQNRTGPVNGWELMQIAAIQQAISAFEDVIADLDAETEAVPEAAILNGMQCPHIEPAEQTAGAKSREHYEWP